MFPEFNSTSYFIDLLALCLVLVPLIAAIKKELARHIILTISGAALLYYIAPRLLVFYTAFWLAIFVLQRIIALTTDQKIGTLIFWVCAAVLLTPMVTWKLNYDEFSTVFNLITNDAVGRLFPEIIWNIDLARQIIIPIGLSFATFRGIDLLVKTWVGKLENLSLSKVLHYGFFPPVQIVGPIIEYEEIQKHQKITAEDIYQGFLRISFGLIKVLLLAAILQKSAVIFQTYDTAPILKIWAFLFIYTWFFYLNFSGYSDLAIGTSRLMGYKLKENFCFPYFRRNIAEFWNNWHMSLSRFAQRYAFVPLGGYRKKTQYLAILGTIFIIALWHDISWGMVLFALYHGAGLIIHRIYSNKYGDRDKKSSLPVAWLKIAGTYLFVVLSFPLLVLPLEKASEFYLSLVGITS